MHNETIKTNDLMIDASTFKKNQVLSPKTKISPWLAFTEMLIHVCYPYK